MKSLTDLSERQILWLLIGLNIVLKLFFLFIDVTPSDVTFYESTGWFFQNGVLPYERFDPLNGHYQIYWNSWHPNGPLNYLFYYIILTLFGNSVFAIKASWLVAEIIIACCIYKIGILISKKETAFIVALLYTVCIPCYYPGILVGCDELITGAFAIMGVYYFLKERPMVSGLLLALGISYKLYPVFFFIPMAMYAWTNRKPREFVTTLLVAILTYAIIALPYLLLCPEDFFQYTFGQANRLITISYGYYLQGSWFYRPIFQLPAFLGSIAITPHFCFEIIIMGGYLLWEILRTRRSRKYGQIDFFRAITYYIAMLPVVSLSYNYRYLQWVLPPLLLFLLCKQKSKRIISPITQSKNETVPRNNEEKTFFGFNVVIFYSLIAEFLLATIYFIQLRTDSYEWGLLGLRYYNNYLFTFLYIFTGFIAIIGVVFRHEPLVWHSMIFAYLQGLAGILLYYSLEGREYYEAHEMPFLWLSMLMLVSSLIILYFICFWDMDNKRTRR